jgi:sugar-specific transcriptional regulator TrmB
VARHPWVVFSIRYTIWQGHSLNELVRHLQELGLADNEARCYAVLHVHGPMSGYEIARRSGIARGNVYPSLDRLLSKAAVVRASDDRFLAVPIEQFVTLRQASVSAAAAGAVAELEQLGRTGEYAQVLSVRGDEAILARARNGLSEAPGTAFLAGFPEDLAALAPAVGEAVTRGVSVEILSYGAAPATLPDVVEHGAAEEIRRAQGGRLLLLAAWPHGLIGVLGGSEGGAGVWAWNRYVASAVGLYVAHERFLIRLWATLPEEVRRSAVHGVADLSSRIALGGLVPGMAVAAALHGAVTPPATDGRSPA